MNLIVYITNLAYLHKKHMENKAYIDIDIQPGLVVLTH